jgi:hypothetical protein
MESKKKESEGRFDKLRRVIFGDKPSWEPLANYCKNFQPTDYSSFHCQNGYRRCNEDCRNFESLSQEEIERRDLVRRDFKHDELQEMLEGQKKPLSLTDEEGLPIKRYINPYEKYKKYFFFQKGIPIPHYGEHPTKRNIAFLVIFISVFFVLWLMLGYLMWGYI